MAMVGPSRAALKSIRSDLPMDEVAAMDAVVAKTLVNERFLLWIAGAFAVLASVLAVGGVYGVTVAAADRWKREMGIRLALGAAPATLFATVLRRGGAVVAWGLVVGGLGSVVVHRFVGALLYQTSPRDPIAILAVLTLLATGGVLASLPAAFRAMRTSPASALSP
jgi:putative ABC transport system permease protein